MFDTILSNYREIHYLLDSRFVAKRYEFLLYYVHYILFKSSEYIVPGFSIALCFIVFISKQGTKCSQLFKQIIIQRNSFYSFFSQ